MLNLGLVRISIFSLLALVVVGPERTPWCDFLVDNTENSTCKQRIASCLLYGSRRVESQERREKAQNLEEALKKQKEMIEKHKTENGSVPPQGVSQDPIPPPHNTEDTTPPHPKPEPFIPFDHEPHTPTQ